MHEPKPCLGDIDALVMVFRESSRAVTPCVGSFDDPALGQHLKGGDRSEERQLRPLPDSAPFGSRALDHLDVERKAMLETSCALTGITAVDEELLDPGILHDGARDDFVGTIAILHARAMNDDGQQRPERVGQDMALAPFDFFSRIETVDPPFSAVRTD